MLHLLNTVGNTLDTFFPQVSYAAPAAAGKRLLQFLLVITQAAALFAIVYFYAFERENGLHLLLPWFLGAFAVHYWLPARFKDAFFVFATMAAIYYALGPFSGSVLIVGVLGMIGIAHLPIAFRWRVVLLLLAAVALIGLRLQLVYIPRVLVAVPLMGVLLMFRLIIYMYELRYEKKSPTVWQRLAYFFLLPNICFPLFPIVDYKTFLRTHYDTAPFDIYQAGLRRILRGITHMLVYRVLYYYVVPSPASLNSCGEMLLYITSNYAMILRLSGMFWMAIGVLGLFGWNLPPMFDNFFLIPGFGEIWRRINIYWKDFVMKIFYYPIYFRLRKKIKRNLILITTLLTFFITWLLHSWQWFWVRGSFPLTLMNALYWLILGTRIGISLAREERRGPVRKKAAAGWTFRSSFFLVLRIIVIFLFMSLLWSLWGSASPGEWFYLLSHVKQTNGHELLLIFGSIAGLFAVGIGAHYIIERTGWSTNMKISNGANALLTYAACGLLALPLVHGLLPSRADKIAADLRNSHLNQFDKENAEQGYYEKLLENSSQGRSPWEAQIRTGKRDTWFNASEEPANNLLLRKLKKNVRIVSENGQTFTTNSFGMRDKEYTLQKPANTIRIAVLGASYEMGGGVSDEEVFEALLEKQLNDSLQKAGSDKRVEILNFAVGAYGAWQQAWLCDSVVFRFQPDIVMTFAHTNELHRLNGNVARMIQNGVDLHYDFLKELQSVSGATQDMSRTEIRNRLQAYDAKSYGVGMNEIIWQCTLHHTPLYTMYLPALGEAVVPGEYPQLNALTDNRNKQLDHTELITLQHFSLADVYGNAPAESLQVSPGDNHPNAAGHRLIAAKLYHLLTNDPGFSRMLKALAAIPN